MKNRKPYVRMVFPLLVAVPALLFMKTLLDTAHVAWGDNLFALLMGAVGGFALVLLEKISRSKTAT
ncbi:MAG: hypothetical protein ACYDB1_11955 [Acidiferrobacteraceae bacterium]